MLAGCGGSVDARCVMCFVLGTVAACTDDDSSLPSNTESLPDSSSIPPPPSDDPITSIPPPPPPLEIVAGDATHRLGAHSYSGESYAVDGTTLPPSGPAVVVSGKGVVIRYPLEDWLFTAEAVTAGGADVTIAVDVRSDGAFQLRPPTRAGAYDIWIYGERVHDAAERETAGFSFRWRVSD